MVAIKAGRARSGAGYFLGWAATGACFTVALLAPLTIGPFVLAVAVAATGLLVWRRGPGRSCAGLLSGAGLILLYIAYLNRGGPGQVCTATATAQQCTSEWSPWPFLALGVLLVAAGPGVFLVLRRRLAWPGPRSR